jgi:hypothetical protein
VDEREATALLEVESGTRGQDLKRAYLRKVKLHPPERDPDNFTRIVQAYELLTARLDPCSKASPSQDADAVAARAESTLHPHAFALDTSASEGKLEELAKQLQTPDLSAPTLLSALQKFGRHEASSAFELLREYLWKHGRFADVEALLSSAGQGGLPGLERHHLEHNPSSVDSETLWRLTQQVDCVGAAQHELARRGDLDLFEQYTAQISHARGNTTVDLSLGIILVLGLMSAGQSEEAQSALPRLVAHLEDIGARKDLEGGASVQLQVALELSRLPLDASHFRSIVARAMLDLNPAAAEASLIDFARSQRKLAELILRHLELEAPTLRQLFEKNLRGKKSAPKVPPWIYPLILVVSVHLLGRVRATHPEFTGPVIMMLFMSGGLAGAVYAVIVFIQRVKARWRQARE